MTAIPVRPIVSLKRVEKTYRQGDSVVHAVDQVDIEIFPGEFTVGVFV